MEPTRTRPREPAARYVDPDATIDEGPQTRHYALGASWLLFAITLLALFAADSLQGIDVHGAWWLLAAVPAAFLALALLLTFRLVLSRRARR